MTDKTPIDKRCSILADLWITYRNDDNFQDFISYNDLGLPLAYAIDSEIVNLTPRAEQFINETFEVLLSALDMVDTGFDSLALLLDDDFPDMGLLSDE